MRTAAEEFAIQLGRASKRSAHYLRWARGQDRDDIIATAMLSAWEARANYDPTKGGLDDWFAEHMKVAAKESKKQERRQQRSINLDALRDLQNEPSVEGEERGLETADAARVAMENLTELEREVAERLAAGESMRAIRQIAGSNVTRRMFAKLRRLKDLLPDAVISRGRGAGPLPASDNYSKMAEIDHEIERMLRRPATEQSDCPVCWRCCWFDGLTPKNYHAPTHVHEPDVLAAVRDTEARKILIGSGERL